VDEICCRRGSLAASRRELLGLLVSIWVRSTWAVNAAAGAVGLDGLGAEGPGLGDDAPRRRRRTPVLVLWPRRTSPTYVFGLSDPLKLTRTPINVAEIEILDRVEVVVVVDLG
jgi:hypothetical protein